MYPIILLTFLIYILLYPGQSVNAAALGLELWYENMLPTLLPFAILSYVLIHSGILDSITKHLHHVIKHLFPVSSAGLYPLLGGLLFGFPMGSKITAELVETGGISKEEGRRLYCICNNISPMFVSSFLLEQCLHRYDLKGITLLILYAPPIILYMIINCHRHFSAPMEKNKKKPTPMNFQLIDAGIMNGFETLAKLGGYLMIFAILAQMTTLIPIQAPKLKCFLIGFTEITNGIAYTSHTITNFKAAYPMMMAYTAFGGLSGLAQTASMIKNTGFSLIPYIFTKLAGTCISFGLATLLVAVL